MQGVFPGEERDGSIECLYYEQLMTSPRDPSSGIANGHVKHNAVVIRKQVDSTSPFFACALDAGETLETVIFRFIPSNHTAGMLPAIYFVKMTNASVASFKQYFTDTPSARYFGWQLVEEIGFYYQKIEWGFNEREQASSSWGGL